MKRKNYRDRTAVLLSVEKDHWKDFIDLCDKERKSASLKFAEMLTEELQKNALGVGREPNPLKLVSYITNHTNKAYQSERITLDMFMSELHEVKDNLPRLWEMERLTHKAHEEVKVLIQRNRYRSLIKK